MVRERVNENRLRFLLPLQPPQATQLITADLVRGRLAMLLARNVHRAVLKSIASQPRSQISEAMPVSQQDHGGVAVAGAVAFGRLDRHLDLSLSQVFPLPVTGIGPSAGRRRNCSLSTAEATRAPVSVFEKRNF